MEQRAYRERDPMAPLTTQVRPSRVSRLVALVLPVVVVGALGMTYVVSLARLSELEYEARRLERLSLEQAMRRAELLRLRGQLTSHTVLWEYANREGLAPAGEPRPMRVGSLPERQMHWKLPGEADLPVNGNGAMIGWQLPPPGVSPAPGL